MAQVLSRKENRMSPGKSAGNDWRQTCSLLSHRLPFPEFRRRSAVAFAENADEIIGVVESAMGCNGVNAQAFLLQKIQSVFQPKIRHVFAQSTVFLFPDKTRQLCRMQFRHIGDVFPHDVTPEICLKNFQNPVPCHLPPGKIRTLVFQSLQDNTHQSLKIIPGRPVIAVCGQERAESLAAFRIQGILRMKKNIGSSSKLPITLLFTIK